eukprot:7909067-Ditylum_brightwellii.AAC.1
MHLSTAWKHYFLSLPDREELNKLSAGFGTGKSRKDGGVLCGVTEGQPIGLLPGSGPSFK